MHEAAAASTTRTSFTRSGYPRIHHAHDVAPLGRGRERSSPAPSRRRSRRRRRSRSARSAPSRRGPPGRPRPACRSSARSRPGPAAPPAPRRRRTDAETSRSTLSKWRDEVAPGPPSRSIGNAGDEEVGALGGRGRDVRELRRRPVAGRENERARRAARRRAASSSARVEPGEMPPRTRRRPARPRRFAGRAARRAHERIAVVVAALRAVGQRRDRRDAAVPEEACRRGRLGVVGRAQPRDLAAMRAREIGRSVQRRDEQELAAREHRQLGARAPGVERADHRDDLAGAHGRARVRDATRRAPRPRRRPSRRRRRSRR